MICASKTRPLRPSRTHGGRPGAATRLQCHAATTHHGGEQPTLMTKYFIYTTKRDIVTQPETKWNKLKHIYSGGDLKTKTLAQDHI